MARVKVLYDDTGYVEARIDADADIVLSIGHDGKQETAYLSAGQAYVLLSALTAYARASTLIKRHQ